MKTTDTEKWHGWERRSLHPVARRVSLHIGSYPGRKQVALYEHDSDGNHRPLAFFRSEELALHALEFLDNLVGINPGTVLNTKDEPWPIAGDAA